MKAYRYTTQIVVSEIDPTRTVDIVEIYLPVVKVVANTHNSDFEVNAFFADGPRTAGRLREVNVPDFLAGSLYSLATTQAIVRENRKALHGAMLVFLEASAAP